MSIQKNSSYPYYLHESEHRSIVSDSLQPCGLYSPWDSPGQNTGVGSLSLLQGIFPTWGSNKPRSLPLQVDSLPAEPQGKPKNTGVGSLSLLQGIFPTQESNWGLLHCRWILYRWATKEALRTPSFLVTSRLLGRKKATYIRKIFKNNIMYCAIKYCVMEQRIMTLQKKN